MIQDRAQKTRALLQRCGLEALVFLDQSNLRYLCGFTGSDGALVVTQASDCFLTDSRYTTQAAAEVAAAEVRQYQVKVEGIAGFLRETGAVRVGFEAATTPCALYDRLRDQAPEVEWRALEDELKPLRAAKDRDELAALEVACELNRRAFEEVLPEIRPGVSERTVALALEFALKRLGGEEKAFDFIVASGPRGALPHGVAGDRVLQAGELVTLDFGVRKSGYHSDETVTLALGTVTPRLREIFETVREAHDLALAALRPGARLKAVDAVAREHIAAKGYGEFFGHGLGHGVGLEVHEYPALSPRSEATAEPGMVVTVEPGIYIPEVGGVRIEDMAVVTAQGCRTLTRIPKTFRSLPA